MMRTHLFVIIVVEYVNASYFIGGAFNVICDMSPLYWPGQLFDLGNFVRNFDFSAENQFLSKIVAISQVPSKF